MDETHRGLMCQVEGRAQARRGDTREARGCRVGLEGGVWAPRGRDRVWFVAVPPVTVGAQWVGSRERSKIEGGVGRPGPAPHGPG